MSATTSSAAVVLMGTIAERLVASFAREDGGGIAVASGALRREAVREFVGGE